MTTATVTVDFLTTDPDLRHQVTRSIDIPEGAILTQVTIVVPAPAEPIVYPFPLGMSFTDYLGWDGP